jgi:hypothetical protein
MQQIRVFTRVITRLGLSSDHPACELCTGFRLAVAADWSSSCEHQMDPHPTPTSYECCAAEKLLPSPKQVR